MVKLYKLPNKCFALDVSPFLRELILRVVNIGDNYNLDSPEGRLIKVLIDELGRITPTKNWLPISDEFHIKKVTDLLINDPSDKRNIEDFAGLACTSSRTLARLFVKELGLTFSDWRKQVRLIAAIEKLEKGISVSQISIDLGYNSPSAFIEMFRKEYDVSPTNYIQK